MAPENLVMNAQDTRTFDAGLASISVGTGSVIVTDDHEPTVVGEGESKDLEGKPSLALYSPNGANLSLTYANEVPVSQESTQRASGVSAVAEPSERGDTGGNGCSYESRTLEELRELASERKIKGRAGLTKDELIEALRA
jgi:hypothetical protein